MKSLKKGITLVTLVLTIMVAIILASASIVTVSNSLNNAKKAAFAEELSVIEDQSLLYYLQNGEEYPAYKNEDETLISKTPSEIKGIVGDKKFSSLIEEMKLNKENGEEDITEDTQLAFYVIDLDKLSLDKKTRGIKKDGSEEDVYVISAKTNRVYYLKGEKIGGKTYYSLANLIKYTNKVTSEEDNQVEVIEVGSLIVKRAKKTWTNTLGITIQVKDTEEGTTNTINVKLKNEDGEIGTSSFEMESEYTLSAPIYLFSEVGFKMSELSKFMSSSSKIMEFTKGEDTVVIDVSNFDFFTPAVDLDNLTKNIVENGNVLTFKVKDTLSGIKEVKYDYLQIYDENGELQNYYKDTEKLDASFVKARGKKADISAPDENGYVTVTIKVPFNVEGIQVCTSDKAGNTSTSTIGVYDFDNDPYIGCELKSISNAGLTFKAVFNTNDSNKKLTKYTAKVSTDNTTYTGDYSETLSTSKEKYSKLIQDYKTGLQIEKKVYVKISATIAGVAYERIFEFDISDADKLKEEETSNTPPIPNGFVGSEATGENNIDTGFVIYEGEEPVTDDNVEEARTTRNQFVWIPVDEDFNKFARTTTYDGTITDPGKDDGGSKTVVYSEPFLRTNTSDGEIKEADQSEKDEYHEMRERVANYGGFYIARYEASRDRSTLEKIPKSVANQDSWIVTQWGEAMDDTSGGAVEYARNQYPASNAKEYKDPVSTLCYGVQWDAMTTFLEKNYPGIANDTGNYGNIKTKAAIKTGSNSAYAVNNIYDVVGNLWEWTMEAKHQNNFINNYRILRGGGYNLSWEFSYRLERKVTQGSEESLGFRVAMYLK